MVIIVVGSGRKIDEDQKCFTPLAPEWVPKGVEKPFNIPIPCYCQDLLRLPFESLSLIKCSEKNFKKRKIIQETLTSHHG